MCSSGIGAIGNVYALVSSIGPYPAWIWASLLLFKLIVIVAAVMLLRMQKVAVWLYLAVFVAEMALSIFVTRPYTPVPLWQYAVSLGLLGLYAFIVQRHWNKLLPSRDRKSTRLNSSQ